ncbi:LysE family translocator [Chitinimonas sp.]|uniref:LysE family translocator n=1 Tax=Chitinimonas sp. TaxID=1934313 RepID=UPI002F927778
MDQANLWLYFVLVFGVIVLPGMDMAFVMGSAMTGGRRTGLAAVAGIMAGGVCHMVMGALGVGLLLSLLPGAFVLMLCLGAGYMAWIGWSLIQSASVVLPVAANAARTPLASFRRAVLTSLLNPKAYLFMLAIFPQFIRPHGAPVWAQASVLSVITAATQFAVYGALAILAAQVRGWLQTAPRANTAIARMVGAVLILAAGWTVCDGLQRFTPPQQGAAHHEWQDTPRRLARL